MTGLVMFVEVHHRALSRRTILMTWPIMFVKVHHRALSRRTILPSAMNRAAMLTYNQLLPNKLFICRLSTY